MKLLCALLLLLTTVAGAEEAKPPKIITEQRGNVTNYRIEGARAPSQDIGCIPIVKAKNTFTPPDLFKGAEACITQDNYHDAARLLLLAYVYSDFDFHRVTDESAKEAGYISYLEFISHISKFLNLDKFHSKMNKELKYIFKKSKELKKYCTQIQEIGYPRYYPNYMILHGLKAFYTDPHQDALVKDFDAQTAWHESMRIVVDCP